MIAELSEIKHRAKELGLDGNKIRENMKIVKNNFNLIQEKIIKMFDKEYDEKDVDVDKSIYTGGFFTKAEKDVMTEILTAANSQTLKELDVTIKNSRLPEMFFRFKGRNYPFELKVKEMENWNKHCVRELTKEDPEDKTHYNFNRYYLELTELKEKYKDNNIGNNYKIKKR